jgi:hypothetical protein
MQLTLITPYRDRLPHLNTQLTWWQTYPHKHNLQWIVVELTPTPTPELQTLLASHQVQYRHLPSGEAFHKTKALNLALNLATGNRVAAFDVDLIPLGQTLQRHYWLAEKSPYLLITGYRLMASTPTVDIAHLNNAMPMAGFAIAQATLGPEDQPTALRKYLLNGERFGIMPMFSRDRLLAIGGWDETYIGWGAEDQDLIERYLTPEQTLCRCHELTYLHLHHDPAPGWNDDQLTAQNRAYYYRTRQPPTS